MIGETDMEEIKKEKKKSFLGGILSGILIAGTILTVVFVVLINRTAADFEDRIQALSAKKQKGETNTLITKEFTDKSDVIFQGVVKEFYFEEDIDIEKMHDNMYKAIISSLGDKYAEYYTAEELSEMMADSEGVYYGIGSYVEMDSEKQYPKLTGVFDGSPASKAGLKNGDIIFEVDGLNIFGYTLTEAVNMIKGPENTDVTLTVYREGESDYLTFVVTRGKVSSPTVEHEMKTNDIGYLRIKEFDDVTTGQFIEAYEDLKSQNMKAMILDLRDNPGGNLSTVLQIAEKMLPEGIITYTEDRNGKREEYRCLGANEIQIPVVMLTNGYSASASELLTGAMKDYGKAVVIGTNTYGKGIVQTIYPLDDGSGIKITTSRYYTPSGVCIHGTGIAPDIELEYDSQKASEISGYDNQIEYAIEYLNGKIR